MPKLAPEDLQQIVAAISQTPQFDFLSKLVDAFETPDALIEALQGAAGAGGDEFGGAGDELPPDGGEGDDLANLEDVLGGDTGEEPDPALDEEAGGMPGGMPPGMPAGMPPGGAPPEEEEPVPERRSMPTSNTATVEKYTQLQRSHQEALKDMSAMHSRIGMLERVNADHARKAKLNELAQRFPHFVDPAEEGTRCLYSQKASMSDAEFTKHVGDLERYAEKAQKASVYIPSGDAPKTESDTPEKYAMSQKVNQRAVQIATAMRNRGEQVDYETAKAMARKELTQ
jgi:hypothetical protein